MVNKEIEGRTWVGVVEENIDPLKLDRIKARVRYLHGDLPLEVLPWIHPRKDSNGNVRNLPRKGKVVNIDYAEGDINSGEYVGAEHYNINLQNMLDTMEEEEYAEFVAVYYDHATQLYRSTEKGLVMDHEYSNINLDNDGNISHNLRDNKGHLNLGSANASQSMIMGDHFMDWLDTLMDALLQGGFLGNLGAPTIANPQLIQVITKYKAFRDPVFLSKHVFAVDNNKVTTQKRPYKKQTADEFAMNSKVETPAVEETPYAPQEPTQDEIDEQEAAKAEATSADDTEANDEFYHEDSMSDDSVTEEVPVFDEAGEEEQDTSGAPAGTAAGGTGTAKAKKPRNPDATKHLGDLTYEQFKKYLPKVSAKKLKAFMGPLNATMAKYNINTALRKAHFLAQIAHETQNLVYTQEIASGKAYEGRKDLGNVNPGDGQKFKGRGLIQLTGRDNYKAYGRFAKVDLLSDPGQVATDEYLAADVAGWFWVTRRMRRYPGVKVLLKFSDEDNVPMVSKLVNGGTNGLPERKRYTAFIKSAMNIA